MNATIYSKDNCPWCEKAKEIFKDHGIAYTEYKYGVDYDKDKLLSLLPHVPEKLTVPQIWLDGEYIGGHDDLVKYLNTRSL